MMNSETQLTFNGEEEHIGGWIRGAGIDWCWVEIVINIELMLKVKGFSFPLQQIHIFWRVYQWIVPIVEAVVHIAPFYWIDNTT